MFFKTAFNNSLTLFCRGIDKVNVIVSGGIIQSTVTLAANILFLIVFEWGIVGYLIANTIGSILTIIWYFIGAEIHHFIKLEVRKCLLKACLLNLCNY